MDMPSERDCRLLRMFFWFVRVRKWSTAIGRRTILPFFVILIRSVTDLLMVIFFVS